MLHKDVQNLLIQTNSLIKISNEFENINSRKLAPRFNVLNFLNLNENKISELFGFLLDPAGDHAHGHAFLNEFLQKLSIPNFEQLDNVQVYLEFPTSEKRRIDILIRDKHWNQAVAIENKIYHHTEDQEGQLSDYHAFLNGKTKGNFKLLYLSPDGKEPSKESISEDELSRYKNNGTLEVVHYNSHIIPCLQGFLGVCENERLRAFINDFKQKMENWYSPATLNLFMEKTLEQIKENGQIEAAFEIIKAVSILKDELKKKFDNQLSEVCKELKLVKVENKLKIIPPNWTNHAISFSYEAGGILYGLTRNEPDPKKSRIEPLEDLFHRRQNFNVSQVWPMYAYFYSNIENDHEFWSKIQSGEAKERAKEFITTILEGSERLKGQLNVVM